MVYNLYDMVNLIVKEIIEEDFGCEGRPEGHIPMCRVLVRDYDGNEMYVSVPDENLYKQNIEVGDQVHFIGEDIVKG